MNKTSNLQNSVLYHILHIVRFGGIDSSDLDSLSEDSAPADGESNDSNWDLTACTAHNEKEIWCDGMPYICPFCVVCEMADK